jgi:SPP1 gp7 family putative phage head morphogenesis protein
VFPDVLERLANRLDRLKGRGLQSTRTKQLSDLVASLGRTLQVGFRNARKELEPRLAAIGLTEAEFQASVINKASGIKFDLLLPSAAQLREIVTGQPFQGKLLREWFDNLSATAKGEIQTAVRVGIAEGESTAQMVRRVRGTPSGAEGVFGKTRRQTEAVVRTAVNHTTTQAREAVYKNNDDVVKGVLWVATLDARTTQICMGLDGKVFPVNEGPRPPAHINCRSTTAPVLKSWKELGIDLKEAPAGTRASMNGQVPAKLTYGEWLKRQPAAIQDDALGPTRAKLFRSGKVKIDRFTDDRNRPLNLEQLRRREGLSADDVKVVRRGTEPAA